MREAEPRTIAPGASADFFPSEAGTFRCWFSGSFTKNKASALVAIVVGGNMTVAIPAR